MQRVHAHAASAYIDDTTVYTHTKADLQIQASKIGAYAEWAGTPISHPKCAVSAILHGEAHRRGGLATNPERLNSLLGHGAAIKIGALPIPYIPPTETYKYLGVRVSLAMMWEDQLKKTIEHAEDQGHKLARSMASPRQCLETLKTVIKARH